MRSLPLHCLTFPNKDRDYIVIVKQNATMAEDKLKEIETEYLTNPIISANKKEVKEQSGRRFSVDVEADNGEIINVRIEAYGKGSAIRGLASIDRRPKLIIVDDPQDEKDSLSDTVQENDWRWFLSDLLFLGRFSRIFLIGNNLGDKCIIERVFANADEVNFKTSRIPVETNGVPAWPEQTTIEKIYEEKENFRKLGKIDIWLRNKMCLAVAEENQIFRKEDFRYFNKDVLLKNESELAFYCTVDPAASTDVDSDYRAITVIAVNSDNFWYIVDIEYGRWDSSEFIDKLFTVVRRWRLKSVGIEEGVLKQALHPFMLKEMPKRNVFFDIVPLKHGGRGKIERIRMLAPRYKAHTIWHAEDMPWITELETELLAMTMQGSRGLHDDVIDSLAYMEQIAEPPFYGNTENFKNLPREAVGLECVV